MGGAMLLSSEPCFCKYFQEIDLSTGIVHLSFKNAINGLVLFIHMTAQGSILGAQNVISCKPYFTNLVYHALCKEQSHLQPAQLLDRS